MKKQVVFTGNNGIKVVIDDNSSPEVVAMVNNVLSKHGNEYTREIKNDRLIFVSKTGRQVNINLENPKTIEYLERILFKKNKKGSVANE